VNIYYYLNQGYIFYGLAFLYIIWAFFYIKIRNTHKVEYQEIKKVLKTMDDFLAKLPQEDVKRFVKTDEYRLYKKVLNKYGLR